MKKVLIATLAAAAAGGAFANPLVYEYRAGVKHFYLKKISVKDETGTKVEVYQKVQKSSSLKGYLIVDDDGVTSPAITGNGSATCYDQGRNRAFLVVINKSINETVNGIKIRKPKVLPAVLEAKWFDPKLNVAAGVAKKGKAEGTLFVGGESIAPVRPRVDYNPATETWTERGVDTLPAANTPGVVAYSDYVWTSVYLFGVYNGPNWYGYALGANPFDAFEAAWDGNLPAGTTLPGCQTGRQGGEPIYHDTWMNGGGFGTYVVPGKTTSGETCCGLGKTTTYYTPILDTLSGNLKGGIYLCTDNGILVDDYEFVGGITWDDQFVTSGHFRGALPDGNAITYAADKWQTDIWQDGAVEQETTDVAFGTWSIKRYTKAIAKPISAADDDVITTAGFTYANTEGLLGTIKGAILSLDSTAKWLDGREIYTMTPATRSDIPVLTPQFIEFYGLVD